ncbi:MAG: hypothetical protein GQ575_02360 [Deltaproteobacteria bacterium]|nr:hypothetical protein [Deltaproteobacteria bacterium]
MARRNHKTNGIVPLSTRPFGSVDGRKVPSAQERYRADAAEGTPASRNCIGDGGILSGTGRLGRGVIVYLPVRTFTIRNDHEYKNMDRK